MLKSCFARLRDNRLFCFYHQSGRGISYRIYENNRWGKENGLIGKGMENFTVNINDGVIYVFCQDDVGDIILCSNNAESNSEWTRRTVLTNQSSRIRMIQLNTIITPTGLCLVYNAPSMEDKSNYIVRQMLDDDGSWSPSERIDRFVSLSDSLFQMQRVADNHYILYYITRSNELNLGYREITPERYGRFNSLCATGNIVSDTSFLTTGNNIHVLYVVKSMFSAQLLYRNKENPAVNNPVLLAEAQRIENCLLFYANGIIYATYINNSQLLYCMSEDNGVSFSRPTRYTGKLCYEPIKAGYLSEPELSEETFFCRQVYVDRTNPWDVQLMPDLYRGFYPEPAVHRAEPRKPVAQAVQTVQTVQEPVRSRQLSEQDAYFMPPEDYSSDIENSIALLRHRLSMSEDIINEKDKQIFELSAMMKSRIDEMSEAQYESQSQYRSLNALHEKTIEKLRELEKQNAELLREIEKKAEADDNEVGLNEAEKDIIKTEDSKDSILS